LCGGESALEYFIADENLKNLEKKLKESYFSMRIRKDCHNMRHKETLVNLLGTICSTKLKINHLPTNGNCDRPISISFNINYPRVANFSANLRKFQRNNYQTMLADKLKWIFNHLFLDILMKEIGCSKIFEDILRQNCIAFDFNITCLADNGLLLDMSVLSVFKILLNLTKDDLTLPGIIPQASNLPDICALRDIFRSRMFMIFTISAYSKDGERMENITDKMDFEYSKFLYSSDIYAPDFNSLPTFVIKYLHEPEEAMELQISQYIANYLPNHSTLFGLFNKMFKDLKFALISDE
ncbi:MAG: hypothetical protein MHMPM18_002695, partial [Marteilia pararefringens]